MQLSSGALRNQIEPVDRPFHSWYQFVLGYPPHFVRYCISKFGTARGSLVLDPFCGTGTTNVECKKLGIDSLGLEANPMTQFAAHVKTDWEVSADELERSAFEVASAARQSLRKFGLSEDNTLFNRSMFPPRTKIEVLDKEPRLDHEQTKVLPKDFISHKPLRKVLVLKELILQVQQEKVKNALLLALANVTVNDASNLAFGPEVYASKKKADAPVIGSFLIRTNAMSKDLRSKPETYGQARIELGDARRMTDYFHSNRGQVNCVITSPPYPNEKDYTRITRLESIVLGFIKDRLDLRNIKTNLLRSNSRNIFVSDTDDQFVKNFPPIKRLADRIEHKRISLGKTSGFERLYHKIVGHYFGGMYRHLASLKGLLAPDAKLAYIVGDQMSYFRVNIPTAELLGEIAESLDYRTEGIELWRTRAATITRTDLNENILILSNR
jgi:hypothetical protein